MEKKGKLNEALDLLKQCSYLENQELSTRLNILQRSGEIASKLNQNDLAVSLYKQALTYVAVDSEDAISLKISLAKLFMQVSIIKNGNFILFYLKPQKRKNCIVPNINCTIGIYLHI